MTPDEAHETVETLRQLANRLEDLAFRRSIRNGDLRRTTDGEWRHTRADVAATLRELAQSIEGRSRRRR